MSQQDDNQEQSFNDAELQDIMNEIESLEREFVEEESEAVAEAPVEAEPVETPVNEAPVEEVETQPVSEETPIAETEEESAAELVSEVEDDQYEDNVVSMDQRRESPVEAATSGQPGTMQFSANGEMDLNLNFPLGDSQAQLTIKDGKLLVTMAGVELNLSEDGCEVSMEGGVKFSVPVSATAAKKAA